MSEMPEILALNDKEIIQFTESMPTAVRVLARFILWNQFVTTHTWSFARLVQKREPTNELIDYIANYDPNHLEDAYANVMEDILNDWIARWRSGS